MFFWVWSVGAVLTFAMFVVGWAYITLTDGSRPAVLGLLASLLWPLFWAFLLVFGKFKR